MRAVIVTTHPIQYQAPLFRLLSRHLDLHVVFMMRQTPRGQARGGFGVEFDWDIPLLEGYRYTFANNIARDPSTHSRTGIILSGHELILGALKPDVLMVMGWFPHGYSQVINWARQRKVPLVCRGESNLLGGGSRLRRALKALYFPWLFRKFSAFAVIGKRNREFYQHYGVGESRLYDAPYSVGTDYFIEQFRMHRPARRRAGPWRLGFAGKLISKKRVLDLVLAAGRSAAKKSLELVFIGDGPLRSEAGRLAREHDVKVEFRGFLNQSEIVAKGYYDLDAIVLPSNEGETWGLVINEAMTGGIPAIVSDLVGCAPDLVNSDEVGYVFPFGDVSALARRIDDLVARLESGHDFTPFVKARIAKYSIGLTATGIEQAFAAAVR